MTTNGKKIINTSTPSFEELITKNGLYVDKTEYFYKLISPQTMYYFLSRPRRFGKTLMVDTLEAIFQGKKELFKDLYIGKTDYDFKEYPVIRLDFSRSDYESAELLTKWINNKIISIGAKYGVLLNERETAKHNFNSLVENLSKKEKVVVLIDEYDRPLTSNYKKTEELEKVRSVLRGFFEVIKASYGNIRFVFITGVTRYSNAGIFSSMNNLKDISMNEKYATMLGFTQKELEDNFCDCIEKAMEKIKFSKEEYLLQVKDKYDGYCFFPGSETLYNPTSVSSFFSDGGTVFMNYWAELGGTEIISDVAKKVDFDVDKDLPNPISAGELCSVGIVEMANTEVNTTNYKALLFQSGYLTIKKALSPTVFVLGYPNKEIQEYYSAMLLNCFYRNNPRVKASGDVQATLLEQEGLATFIDFAKSIYASIPYDKSAMNQNEAYYHTLFHVMLSCVGGAVPISEKVTNVGRIDTVIELNTDVYLFEFKLNKSASTALAQINNKGYYEQYINPIKKKTIHLVGINFSTKERNITDYKECIIT